MCGVVIGPRRQNSPLSIGRMVAGAAMGVGRQPVEARAGGLRAAAAGAEQIPAQLQHAEPRGLKAGLDRVPLGHAPLARQGQRAEAFRIDLQGRCDQRRQALGEAVAIGAPGQLRADPLQALRRVARQRFGRRRERNDLLAAGEPVGLQRQPPEGAFGRSKKSPGQHQVAEEAARLDLQAVIAAAAGAGRGQREARVQRPQRPATEAAPVLEPALAHPVARQVLPFEVDAAEPRAGDEGDAAVGLRDLGDGLPGQRRGRVVAGGVGHRGPDGREGPLEGEGKAAADRPAHRRPRSLLCR
jgi:hypothetical protein